MTLAEALQVLRGAGKVGAAFATIQGEQLRLMACNTTLGAGVASAQAAVTDVLSTMMGGGQVGVNTFSYSIVITHWSLCIGSLSVLKKD